MTDHEEPTFPFFMTPSEIYRQLTEGSGSHSLRVEQREIYREWSQENDRADLIRHLAGIVKSGWQGEASAGAYGAAMPLAERAYENSAKLDRSQDLLSRQIESFSTAVHSVRPVAEPPESSMDESFPFDVDYEKSVKDYQDSAQHNMVVFRGYDDASSYNETNTPQEFNNDTRSSGDVSVAGPVDTIPVQESAPRDSGQFRDGSPSSKPWSTTGDLAEPGGFETTPHDYRPSPLPSYPGPGQGSPVSAASSGFVGSADTPGSSYLGGFGPRGSGGEGPGGGGLGSGGPVSGMPVGGAPVSGGPGSAGGSGVRNLGPGVGAGVGAVEEAAARRAAQAAAASRAGGVGPVSGPVGAGRGKDNEDTEHQRKVLIEADAEETFGSDVLTAPQVIGDDEYED